MPRVPPVTSATRPARSVTRMLLAGGDSRILAEEGVPSSTRGVHRAASYAGSASGLKRRSTAYRLAAWPRRDRPAVRAFARVLEKLADRFGRRGRQDVLE